MFVAGHFTFRLAVRASVASDGIVKPAAAAHRAVTQHHDMSVVGFHAVEKSCGGEVKSVPDHRRCPHAGRGRRTPLLPEPGLYSIPIRPACPGISPAVAPVATRRDERL